MRKALDALYAGSGALAATFLVAIAGTVLLQVGANLIDAVVKRVAGESLGLVIPSYAEFTGFFLAASTFLALAYTLRAGGHIRVNLVLQHVGGRARRPMELFSIAVGLALSAYFTVYMALLVAESIEFGDVSFGMVPVPLWIPQLAMALGLAALTIALADELWCVARGAEPSYESGEDARAGILE